MVIMVLQYVQIINGGTPIAGWFISWKILWKYWYSDRAAKINQFVKRLAKLPGDKCSPAFLWYTLHIRKPHGIRHVAPTVTTLHRLNSCGVESLLEHGHQVITCKQRMRFGLAKSRETIPMNPASICRDSLPWYGITFADQKDGGPNV